MIRTVFCALCAGFLLLAAPVHAQDDLFTVEAVQVDVTAASALAARDEAFDKAQIDAFTVLAGRMLPESALSTFQPPDAATISTMVEDYEVTAEKLSSVRYIGTYTFRFRQKAVERYLNIQGQSYTNVVSAPLVVLPFYQAAGRTYLWSPYNIWMRAWSRAGSSGALVPLILPLGDLEDIKDIGDEDVFNYNPDRLASLLRRYDAGDAVLALATPDGTLGKANENDPAAGSLTVSLYRTDRGQPEHVQEFVVAAQNNETVGGLLDRAVAESQSKLKQDWKDKTVVPAASAGAPSMGNNSIIARVKIRSLEEWAQTQRTLSRTGAVTGTILKSLSPREAIVEISFRGGEDQLRSALAQSGMTLSAPQYAPGGYSGSPDSSRLVYDLTVAGRPVIQTQPFATPPARQPMSQPAPQAVPQNNGYQGGYRQTPPAPSQQAQSPGSKPPGGYPLPPGNGTPGYTGRF